MPTDTTDGVALAFVRCTSCADRQLHNADAEASLCHGCRANRVHIETLASTVVALRAECERLTAQVEEDGYTKEMLHRNHKRRCEELAVTRAECTRLRALLGEACELAAQYIDGAPGPRVGASQHLARIRAEATSKEGR